MEILIDNAELTALFQKLESADSDQKIWLLLELAWHLWQRDNQSALTYCKEIEQILQLQKIPAHQVAYIQARLTLIRAETQYLRGQFHLVKQAMAQALATFSDLNEHAACADCYWLLAALSKETALSSEVCANLELCRQAASLAGDPLRYDMARFFEYRMCALSGMDSQPRAWIAEAESISAHPNAGLRTWVLDFLGMQAMSNAQFLRAGKFFEAALSAARDSGQIECCVIATLNIGMCYEALNDYESALEWLRRGMEISRPYSAYILGMSMTGIGCVLHKAGKHDSALASLNQAQELLADLPATRAYKMALINLADVAVVMHESARALDCYTQLEADQWIQNRRDIFTATKLGKARALVQLGYLQDARQSAEEGLSLARELKRQEMQVNLLQTLAETASEPQVRLAYLLEAARISEGIQHYVLPGEVYEAIAEHYARHGLVAEAYQYVLKANTSRQKIYHTEISNRALALEIRLQTERFVFHAENAQRIAQEQAQRAELLQQHSDTLSRLGTIGQQITAELDAQAIFQVLAQQIFDLLASDSFGIFLYDAHTQLCTLCYEVVLGILQEQAVCRLTDIPSSYARCVQEKHEIVVEAEDQPMPSQLYAPLLVGERVLGGLVSKSR